MTESGLSQVVTQLVGVVAAMVMVASLLAVRAARSAQRRSVVRGQLDLRAGDDPGARYTLGVPPPVLRWLDSAEFPVPSSVPPSAVVAAIVCPALLVSVMGVAGALGVAVVGCVVAVMSVIARQGRADRRYESDLPDALDQIVRALRSGASLSRALAEAAGRTEHGLGEDLAWLGGSSPSTTLDERLAQWPNRRPISAVRLVAAALALGHESGAGQSVALEGAAESLRVRLDTHAELRSQSAQSRLSAVVIAAAPIGFLGLTALIDPRVPRFLVDNIVGRSSLFAGLLLDAVAAATMIRLTARTVE